MKIDKQKVLDLFINGGTTKSMIYERINALPASEDEWVSVETERPPFARFILTWDGQSIIYRALSRGHDLMSLDEFKERTKITHWLIPLPPTK